MGVACSFLLLFTRSVEVFFNELFNIKYYIFKYGMFFSRRLPMNLCGFYVLVNAYLMFPSSYDWKSSVILSSMFYKMSLRNWTPHAKNEGHASVWETVVDTHAQLYNQLNFLTCENCFPNSAALIGGSCFIGLVDQNDNLDFKWIDGTDLDFTKWVGGSCLIYFIKVKM